MSFVEKLKEHPARFLLPNGMTVARPILGAQALRAAREEDWPKAQKKFIKALMTDMEGSVARPLDATTPFGAMLDPIADGILRLQMALALAPHFNKFFGVLNVALEVSNLAINKEIQDSPVDPIVPKGAKNGYAIQGAGVSLFIQGLKKDSKTLRILGEVTTTTGSIVRNFSYRKLRAGMRESDE